ncbi:mitochondrial carrier domain-containing protein [Halteromyces radiatus]|uniref:mitochondrial carrier domain-containing protein n=1 Tax=Halteromyces radiatus TaxID=101107 RepID=UPI00221FA62A|nr:mitochondrial carrier domain-containing protein [Halteromyces radiatus]KAI8086137.1 mitochondrial carrier domain-containing protein [Halteromyces radiatus]
MDDTGDTESNLQHEIEDLVFGSIAGMVGKVVEYPFDTIKVRLQTQPLDQPHYTGALDCITQTLRHEGVKGLFKGMSLPIIGAMMENATLFVGYRQMQRLIRMYTGQLDESKQLSMEQLMMAGAGSGALATFVLTPVELVKCKLQIQEQKQRQHHHRYGGPLDVMKNVWQRHGIQGYYRGFWATLVRETFGGIFWFGAYEYCCATFLRRKSGHHHYTKKDLTSIELMISGAMGGIGYNMSMFPVDVIKSQMQTDDELRKGPIRSFGKIAKSIYQDAGIKGFYRGCGITALRSAPTSAVIFLTYEQLTQHIRIPI